MTTMIKPAPVRKSLVVKAPPERAFSVFTAGIGRWWPPSHHIGAAAFKDAVVEPRAGGRWYEIGEDGSECQWGHVIAWEPPRRLVLAWQISTAWAFDPDLVTEVEVTFTPQAGGTTRVDLEHRHLERMGEGADGARASFDSSGGWSGILDLFAQAAEA